MTSGLSVGSGHKCCQVGGVSGWGEWLGCGWGEWAVCVGGISGVSGQCVWVGLVG